MDIVKGSVHSKMDKLRNELSSKRKHRFDRNKDLSISRKKISRRFQIKYKNNTSSRERRKARKAAVILMMSKTENIKSFGDAEITENQKGASLCLGQGFIVSNVFNLGSFLIDRNQFQNKIRWCLCVRNKDSNSLIHPYRKVLADQNQWDQMENVFLSYETELLSKKFKEMAD